MRRRNQLVFDEVIPAQTGQSRRYSPRSNQFDWLPGEFELASAIFVLVDEAVVATTFELFIEHSADGKTWVPKNATGATGDVQVSVSTGTTNPGWGSDPGILVNPPTPFLGFVRFRMYFQAIVATGHVKVYVTQRDQGG